MHRLLKSLAIGALALTGLATHATAQTTTIEVTATPAIFKPMFEEFVTAFEKENPDIKVKLDIPPGEQRAMVQDILRRALIDDMPDVTFQGYNYLRALVDRKIPVSLEKFISNDPEWTEKSFSPSIANSGTVNGNVYGLGVGMSFVVLYYNVDLVRKAQGGDATFPDNWDGIIELAGKINKTVPGVIGGFHRFHPWIFQAQVESRGGKMMSPDEKKITFTGSEGLESLKIIRRFAEAGGQNKAAMTREQARQAFVSGTVGIFTDSSSGLVKHEAQIANKFELGVARFPILSRDGHLPAGGVASVLLTRDPERQAAAWKFMKFVASSKGQVIVAEKTAYVPANSVALNNSSALAEIFRQRPKMKAALDTVPFATSWYAFPGKNAAKIDDTIKETVRDVTTLRITPEEALKSLNSAIEKLL